MAKTSLDFSFEIGSVNREALLNEAASLLDSQRAHLHDPSAPATTREGDLVRELSQDRAGLAAMPDVYAITDKDFLDHGRPTPVRFQELSQQFKFYWVKFPIGLMPRRNWAFNRLEVKVEFNPGAAAASRPRGYQILPNRKFQELLKASTRLEVSLDENFELSAKAAVDAGLAKAGASAGLKGSAHASLASGPFEYRVTKALVDHSGTGLEWVFWRLDSGRFFEEDRPELIVIVQVPKAAKEFKIYAALIAYRYFNTGAADWQEAILRLPRQFASFFQKGNPVSDAKEYDLTEYLSR